MGWWRYVIVAAGLATEAGGYWTLPKLHRFTDMIEYVSKNSSATRTLAGGVFLSLLGLAVVALGVYFVAREGWERFSVSGSEYGMGRISIWSVVLPMLFDLTIIVGVGVLALVLAATAIKWVVAIVALGVVALGIVWAIANGGESSHSESNYR